MIREKNIFLKTLDGAAPLIHSDISASAIPLLLGLIKRKASEESNTWACNLKCEAGGRGVPRVLGAARVQGCHL